LPTGQAQRETYAEVVGADGLALLQAVDDAFAPVWLRQVPAVQILRQVRIQNYTWRDNGTLRWRQTDELPPAALAIRSPYDDEVRFSQKRETTWVGYKVHVTETAMKRCHPHYPCRNYFGHHRFIPPFKLKTSCRLIILWIQLTWTLSFW